MLSFLYLNLSTVVIDSWNLTFPCDVFVSVSNTGSFFFLVKYSPVFHTKPWHNQFKLLVSYDTRLFLTLAFDEWVRWVPFSPNLGKKMLVFFNLKFNRQGFFHRIFYGMIRPDD